MRARSLPGWKTKEKSGGKIKKHRFPGKLFNISEYYSYPRLLDKNNLFFSFKIKITARGSASIKRQ
jgi:hypothetical protein